MYHYGIIYEAEIVSGNIFSLSKLHGSKLGDLKETIMYEMIKRKSGHGLEMMKAALQMINMQRHLLGIM